MGPYHSCLFVQVDSDWSNAIGQHRYEKNENLDDGDPVGEVGPVIAGVAPQLPFPVGLGGAAGDAALTASQNSLENARYKLQ